MKLYKNSILLPLFLTSCAAAPIKTVHEPKKSAQSRKVSSKPKLPVRVSGQALSTNATANKAEPIQSFQTELNSIKAYELNEQWLHSALVNADLSTRAVAPKDQETFFRKSESIIINKLSLEDLNEFISVCNSSSLREIAQQKIDQIKKSSDVINPQTIGVILPLSGKNAGQGSRALRGIMLGLGLNNSNSPYKISLIDSEGSADKARTGVQRLVQEDGVVSIIGDITSKSAEAVAIAAKDYKVPVISLSQKSGITDIATNIFRNALTPAQQVQKLVRTAMNDLGMKKFGILIPNDSFGIEYSNLFWDEVLARGGTISAVQTYNPNEKDFKIPVEKFLGIYYGEARQAEYYLSLKEIKSQDKKRSIRQNNNEVVLKPITDFDAIFIPDGSKNFGQLAAMISFYDVTQAKFLGTNLWNTASINKRTGLFGDNIYFVDTFQDPTSETLNKFKFDYKNQFNEDPSLIEMQAYDAALALRQLISQGVDSRESLTEKLTNLVEYPGSVGLVKLTENREFERPATALTLNKGEITPLKVIK